MEGVSFPAGPRWRPRLLAAAVGRALFYSKRASACSSQVKVDPVSARSGAAASMPRGPTHLVVPKAECYRIDTAIG